MFSKIALLAAASIAVFVAAAPSPGGGGGINNSCNTGPVQCCNSVYEANSSEATLLHSLLGVVAGPITGQAGINCSPITAIGIAGNSCSSQPVCCSNNKFNGLVVVGCSPINANA